MEGRGGPVTSTGWDEPHHPEGHVTAGVCVCVLTLGPLRVSESSRLGCGHFAPRDGDPATRSCDVAAALGVLFFTKNAVSRELQLGYGTPAPGAQNIHQAYIENPGHTIQRLTWLTLVL